MIRHVVNLQLLLTVMVHRRQSRGVSRPLLRADHLGRGHRLGLPELRAPLATDRAPLVLGLGAQQRGSEGVLAGIFKQRARGRTVTEEARVHLLMVVMVWVAAEEFGRSVLLPVAAKGHGGRVGEV